MKVSVIGAGAFGTALATQLARAGLPAARLPDGQGKAGNEVKIWVFEEKVRDEINNLHQNLTYLPDIKLPSGILATSDLKEAYDFSGVVFLAPPFFALRKVLPKEGRGKTFILVSKGIERETHKLANEIVEEVVEGKFKLAVMSGPSFAKELAAGLDTKVLLASKNPESAKIIKGIIETKNFKVETSADLIGAELSGALKNVLAILTGMIEGAELGKNIRAAVFTEGLREMIKMGELMGAKKETFYTVAGLGDLFLTSTSDQSRNFTFGYRLGSGDNVKDALKSKNVVEGAGTAESAYFLSKKLNLKAPLFYNVYAVIFEGKDPKRALEDIWNSI